MIALLASLALADPCGRETVIGRGLVLEASDGVSVGAELDVRLKLKKTRVDGIPAWSVRKAWVRWVWTASTDVPVWGVAAYGGPDDPALCAPEQEHRIRLGFEPGGAPRSWTYVERDLEACRVRVVLKDTVPAAPQVRLDLRGATPPGPDAPLAGKVRVKPGSDLVIDIPGCL